MTSEDHRGPVRIYLRLQAEVPPGIQEELGNKCFEILFIARRV